MDEKVSFKSCRIWRDRISSTIDQRIKLAKDKIENEFNYKIEELNVNWADLLDMIRKLENRISALENEEPPPPPPPPPPNGNWEDRIQIEKNFGSSGEIIFEIQGLSYVGNPNNPSKPGKDILLTLTRPPLDLGFQQYAIELRKYAISTTNDLINEIKLKTSKGGRAFEIYMPHIPDWDPSKIYKIRVSWDTKWVEADIETEGVHYEVVLPKGFEISPTILILGANPKYSAPPGAKFRLISY